jgi:hypothetical protein
MDKREAVVDALLETHRGWARWSVQRLQLKYLEVDAELYERGYEFLVLICNGRVPFSDLTKEFDYAVRPATANIKLVESVPDGFLRVETVSDLTAERWLADEPLPTGWVNKLLSLVVPNMPKGRIDFLHDRKRYVFRHFGMTDIERQRVELACSELGIPLPIEYQLEVQQAIAPPSAIRSREDFLELSTLRGLSAIAPNVRVLVERDEDEWRLFAGGDSGQYFSADDLEFASKFSCLFDVRDHSDVQLSELLTIYDVVHVIPTENTEWLDRHRVSLDELEELVSMGRLRLVLPNAIERYPENLITAVADVDASALTLSRSLAVKTIKSGARKDPLLYGPLSMRERLLLLKALYVHAPDEITRNMFRSYGAALEQQHRAFVMRGANACYGVGLGAHLGNVLKLVKGVDAQVEFSTMGASIEWSMGLGAAYIPRQIGGFDETPNASIFASFVSRTKVVPKEPFGGRMHAVVDGLLGLSHLRPIDVARNLRSNSLSQFRHLASSLISGPDSTNSLAHIVAKVNDDVTRFERRRKWLAPFRLDVALALSATKPIYDFADGKFGSWTSTFASYGAAIIAYQLAKSQAEGAIKEMSQGIVDTVIGLALSPSHDAMITWRARTDINR